jgi:hypothetical protein
MDHTSGGAATNAGRSAQSWRASADAALFGFLVFNAMTPGQAPAGSAVRALRQDQALHRLPTVGPVGLRTWDYAFCSDFFFGCRETVVSLLRCPYTVERGTPNRSAICWTVLTRAS